MYDIANKAAQTRNTLETRDYQGKSVNPSQYNNAKWRKKTFYIFERTGTIQRAISVSRLNMFLTLNVKKNT